jgi:kinesin family protein C1
MTSRKLTAAHESSDPDALADIGFSDERTDQETGQSQLVVKSRSESATGREREQINNFTFDKVSWLCVAVDTKLMPRCSSPLSAKLEFSRRSRCWRRACWTATM